MLHDKVEGYQCQQVVNVALGDLTEIDILTINFTTSWLKYLLKKLRTGEALGGLRTFKRAFIMRLTDSYC